MKTFQSTVIFLLAELSLVLATSNGAVITCHSYEDFSWERIREIENASTHRIKEICPGDGEHKVSIEVRGSVKFLYEDSFKGIPKLRKIYVPKTNLEEIEPGTFKDLPQLDDVDLSKNNLQEIKTGTFVNLRVGKVYLQRNSISVLQEGAFVNLSGVKEINFEWNNLQELKRGIFQNVHVKHINLGSNNISKIEVGMFAGVFPLDQDGIVLSFPNNSIAEIDASVFDYKHNIFSLSLSKNLISVLRPGDLRNMPGLKEIVLQAENKLKQIPEGVFNGSKIESINLDYNEISFIASKAFDDMKHLRHISIEYNKLKKWDSNWFCGETPLWIALSTNFLETIPAGAFTNIPEGSTLKLDKNRIKSISDRAFSGVTRLEGIDLSYNKIKKWNVDILKNVVVEDFVDFTGNKIKCPEDGLTTLAPKARRVDFDECF
ncbi:hypothetical protein Zmor_018944 [Zophobas morio]|uniref:Uncharacterized protein n=1 Tax=Zophobas morio TaxID=2755281 RepID=A0AA38IAW7_9CUCU|nr:hypothetical protein Zmor_018944 [Zophobas morio]